MSEFKEYLNETKNRKMYTKKGKMYILKKPLELSNKVDLLAIGHDVNGNKIVKLELQGGKKKTVQLQSSKTITIDDVQAGLSQDLIDFIIDSI